MTNSPKDLDQSDVNSDAQDMMLQEMDRIDETMDPLSLYTVLAMWCDSIGDDFEGFINSHTAKDIIRFSQSNLDGVHDKLMRMHELDNAIADL